MVNVPGVFWYSINLWQPKVKKKDFMLNLAPVGRQENKPSFCAGIHMKYLYFTPPLYHVSPLGKFTETILWNAWSRWFHPCNNFSIALKKEAWYPMSMVIVWQYTCSPRFFIVVRIEKMACLAIEQTTEEKKIISFLRAFEKLLVAVGPTSRNGNMPSTMMIPTANAGNYKLCSIF